MCAVPVGVLAGGDCGFQSLLLRLTLGFLVSCATLGAPGQVAREAGGGSRAHYLLQAEAAPQLLSTPAFLPDFRQRDCRLVWQGRLGARSIFPVGLARVYAKCIKITHAHAPHAGGMRRGSSTSVRLHFCRSSPERAELRESGLVEVGKLIFHLFASWI